MHEFPKGFIWGTATAGHQIEGNNKNSDWWHYENTKEQENRIYPLEPSNEACDSYNRYEEDFDLCKELNNNGVRISIEWARIEPEKGKFNQEALNHYKKVLEAAKKRNLQTFVTLHHFASPQWLAEQGGWHSFFTPKLFSKYVKKCVEELDDLIDFYLTINEPQVYTLLGYIGVYDYREDAIAQWPPAKRNIFLAYFAQIGFMRGHIKAYKTIKKLNNKAKVGVVKNLTWWEADPKNSIFIDKIAAKFLNYLGRDFFLRPIKRHLDFIGLNYYFTNRIRRLQRANPNDYVSDLGWWINPGGLEGILVNLQDYNLPIYITENGLADATDKYRKTFLKDHLEAVAHAIKLGTDVRGYFHWSLIDNYEWHEGFWPRFGLVEIDRNDNLKRKPRPSFYYYAEICKNNRIS